MDTTNNYETSWTNMKYRKNMEYRNQKFSNIELLRLLESAIVITKISLNIPYLSVFLYNGNHIGNRI